MLRSISPFRYLSPCFRPGSGGALVLFLLLGTGCAGDPSSETAPGVANDSGEVVLPEGAQAVSLLGETFFPPPLPRELRSAREADLAASREAWEVDPRNADELIWVGRREAYLGFYREAISTFTQGIERFPDDARFYRHRGHRWITVREFDRAIEDFEQGVAMVRGLPDEVEPDGLPNALGIPLSTLQFNLWYHLALAHYLKGDFEAAVEAWRSCLEVSVNSDLQVATRYWLHLSLLRSGRDEEAAEILARLPADDEIVENDSYHRLLLLFRGDLTPEEVTGGEEPGTLGGTTMAYGIGAWHLLVAGDRDEALRIFQRTLDAPEQWAAFGYLAAEAEVARATRGG